MYIFTLLLEVPAIYTFNGYFGIMYFTVVCDGSVLIRTCLDKF
jgi:hypothetical protein